MAEKKAKGVKIDPIVQINASYRVKLSPTCFILQKVISSDDDKELSKEEKKEGMKNLGFFTSWDYLGTILCRDMQRDKVNNFNKESIVSVKEFIKIVTETNKEVVDLFEKIDKKTSATK